MPGYGIEGAAENVAVAARLRSRCSGREVVRVSAAMTLHHRIAHLERRTDDAAAPAGGWDGAAVPSWSTIASDLHARAHEPDAGRLVEWVLVRIDAEAAILTLVGDSDDALARAWISTVDPWLDAHALVVVESAHQGTEVLRVRGQDVASATSGTSTIDAFIASVAASSVVWGLYGKTWARSDAAGDREALPLWADPVAAARCIAGAWSGFAPRAIELSAFREQWLTGMDEDGIVAVLGPTPDHPGTIVPPGELIAALDAIASS